MNYQQTINANVMRTKIRNAHKLNQKTLYKKHLIN